MCCIPGRSGVRAPPHPARRTAPRVPPCSPHPGLSRAPGVQQHGRILKPDEEGYGDDLDGGKADGFSKENHATQAEANMQKGDGSQVRNMALPFMKKK